MLIVALVGYFFGVLTEGFEVFRREFARLRASLDSRPVRAISSNACFIWILASASLSDLSDTPALSLSAGSSGVEDGLDGAGVNCVAFVGVSDEFFSGIGVSFYRPIQQIKRVNVTFDFGEERIHGRAAALEQFGVALRQRLSGALALRFEPLLGRRERAAHVLARDRLIRPLVGARRRGEFGAPAARGFRPIVIELTDPRPELAILVVQVLRQLAGPVIPQAR